jgi:hypothetical protein
MGRAIAISFTYFLIESYQVKLTAPHLAFKRLFSASIRIVLANYCV